MVFSEGQNTSTECIDILILKDNEEEEDEYFTVSITSAGTEPYARIIDPSVVTITIEGTNTTPASSEDSEAISPLVLGATLGGVSIVAIAVTGCVAAIIVYICYSKRVCCQKTHGSQPEYPVYATIGSKHDGLTVTKPQLLLTDSLSPRGPVTPNSAIETSPNESYTFPPITQCYMGTHREVITTTLNDAYAVATLAANSEIDETDETTATDEVRYELG